ncbi:MAG: heat-inducible transcriptional repressor HrcA [Bacillota bacterium]
MKENRLSERKQKILKAVVDEYIRRANPISSGEIKRKYFEDISSATIRSELSTLEDMGYLVQPHTSAGRVPSPVAYKYYVENFLSRQPLMRQDVAAIDASFSSKFLEVEEIVRTAAKVISDVTNYTSVIVLNNINEVRIRDIKLVSLDKHSALVVIITDSGVIKDNLITIDSELEDGFINDANLLINKIFSGKTVGELKRGAEDVDKELSEFRELFDSVLKILLTYCDDRNKNVYMEGESKMLDYPEASLESAKNFLTVLNDKNSVADIIGESQGDIEFSIKIGRDETGGMDKCAIVTAKYMINGKEVGQAGVIGPERMDYGRVMSVLTYVGETMETIIKPKGADNEE